MNFWHNILTSDKVKSALLEFNLLLKVLLSIPNKSAISYCLIFLLKKNFFNSKYFILLIKSPPFVLY
nr:MAG TPA: hypothetical protein [Caudoviricetes sp.]